MDRSTNETASTGPMADWPNDDLMLRPDTRDYLYENYPRVAPLFDASDLHELFKAHDAPANVAKERSRRWGFVAVALGFLSLALASCSPLLLRLTGNLVPWSSTASSAGLGLVISVLAVSSVVIGYTQALTGRSKQDWITHRLWTERIRQLNFQIIANNLDVASKAIESGNFESWRRIRRKEIDRFHHYHMASTDELLEILWSDQAEDKTWVNPDWQEPPSIEPSESSLEEFIDVFIQQRFGIQLRYTRLRLSGGLGSVRFQSKAISFFTTSLTVLALMDSIALAIMHFLGLTFESLAVQASTTILGVFGGAVIALRALEDGINPTAETDRLEWYLAAVSGLQDRFDRAEALDDKVDIMREMERLSYQEMRRFFITADRSQFIL
jgi:hypothetical protein